MIKKLISKLSPTQKKLARWAGWFFLANAIVWILIATNYLSLLPKFNTIVGLSWRARVVSLVFIGSSFIGYFSLVAYAAWGLVACFSAYHAKRWVFFLSIFLALVLSLALIVDSLVYHLFHFHLWGVVWPIISAGVASDVLVLSVYEWIIIVALALVLLCLELFLAWIAWCWVNRKSSYMHAKSTAYLILFSFFLSYILLLRSYVADQTKAEAIVSAQLVNLEAQLIPFYNNVMGALFPERDGLAKLQMSGGGVFLQLDKAVKKLNYPLHDLRCKPLAKKPNVLLIVVDALRFEALNSEIMPTVTHFSKQAWDFENHYSAGNATGPGIFTLFYGLPYNYWTAMLNEQRTPVLIDQFQKEGYEMALYRSASMEYPAFNKTVFAHINKLKLNTPGNRAYLRDQAINREFSEFLKMRDTQKPFFGFLFYDALHNYCQRPTPYSQPFQPAISVCNRVYLDEDTDPLPYLNRYYNAAHFIDGLIAEVLADLKQHNLSQDTIIIITADHGEEFNDSKKNYWGHTSAYTPWQLHVPFALYVPGQSPKKITSLTTHYDVAPYLLQQVLGCTNPISDYSVGSSLLNLKPPHFFIANSYVDYAILNNERITHIYSQGNYSISDRKAEPILDAKLDEAQLRKAFLQLNRYFSP